MISPAPQHNSALAPSMPLPARARRKSFVSWLARLSIGTVILVVLGLSGKLDLSMLAQVQVGVPLGILIGLCVLALGANSLRWVCLVRATVYNVPVWESSRLALASNIFSFISPAGTGADAGRVFYLVHRHGVGMTRALAVGLIDRLIGLQVLLLCTALLAWLGGGATTMLTGIRLSVTLGALASSGLLVGLVLPSTRRLTVRLIPASWHQKLIGSGDGSEQTWCCHGLLTPYLLSVVGILANMTLPVFSLWTLGIRPEGMSTYFGSAMVVLVNTVAPTPGGLGLGEAAASELLWGAAGASAMVLVRILALGMSLVCSLGYLTRAGCTQTSSVQQTSHGMASDHPNASMAGELE